jgi:transcriptional regulator with XRE-family HTH domain
MAWRPRTGLVEIQIGQKIRELRARRGLTQDALGKMLGVSFQQIQKYESGSNRISPGRLWLLCQRLEVPIASMFEGVTERMVTSKAKRGAKAKQS